VLQTISFSMSGTSFRKLIILRNSACEAPQRLSSLKLHSLFMSPQSDTSRPSVLQYHRCCITWHEGKFQGLSAIPERLISREMAASMWRFPSFALRKHAFRVTLRKQNYRKVVIKSISISENADARVYSFQQAYELPRREKGDH